ncbi:hypothetical protein EDD86DRAFT_212231 [Gorgonomyces haynaldii]|nr:hypothetical protein EDD86DRAFT_212231 [Gorgonomyces haynaldii]
MSLNGRTVTVGSGILLGLQATVFAINLGTQLAIVTKHLRIQKYTFMVQSMLLISSIAQMTMYFYFWHMPSNNNGLFVTLDVLMLCVIAGAIFVELQFLKAICAISWLKRQQIQRLETIMLVLFGLTFLVAGLANAVLAWLNQSNTVSTPYLMDQFRLWFKACVLIFESIALSYEIWQIYLVFTSVNQFYNTKFGDTLQRSGKARQAKRMLNRLKLNVVFFVILDLMCAVMSLPSVFLTESGWQQDTANCAGALIFLHIIGDAYLFESVVNVILPNTNRPIIIRRRIESEPSRGSSLFSSTFMSIYNSGSRGSGSTPHNSVSSGFSSRIFSHPVQANELTVRLEVLGETSEPMSGCTLNDQNQ